MAYPSPSAVPPACSGAASIVHTGHGLPEQCMMCRCAVFHAIPCDAARRRWLGWAAACSMLFRTAFSRHVPARRNFYIKRTHMPEHDRMNSVPRIHGIAPDISQLSNREAERFLAQVELARLAEIDRYWALCQTDPERAAGTAADGAPVMHDLRALACNTFSPPKPGAIGSLSKLTARLLVVDAIREALPGELPDPLHTDATNSFWEDGMVVALRTVNSEPVLVIRFDGPLFNPGTVPDDAPAADGNVFVVCQSGGDTTGSAYEFLTAYAIGSVTSGGQWKNIQLDLTSRNALMRDLDAMETLVLHGSLSDLRFDTRPLPAFPTTCDAVIARLQAHRTALRLRGDITPERQAIVDSRTDSLHRRAGELRRQMASMEDELYRIRCQIAEVEGAALEEETGFARGDRIRHRWTGDEGTLDIVHTSGTARFTLCGTGLDVTGDIRRGEWEKVTAPVPNGAGSSVP